DREVLLQPMRGKPCHRCGWKARSTMNHEQDRIATIVPSNANELVDPADPHGLIALDPVRGDDATQLPHDIDCLLAARKSVRLSNSRLPNDQRTSAKRQAPRSVAEIHSLFVLRTALSID